jgi:hypothetical protein
MIRVQPFPPHDEAFANHVRSAVRRVAPESSASPDIEAPSEDTLRRALSDIRRRYPDVWIREQAFVARADRATETWYAFRDEVPGSARR